MYPITHKNYFIADFVVAASFYYLAKHYRVLPQSSLHAQMFAFATAPLIKALKKYRPLQNQSVDQIATILPCIISAVVSRSFNLSWKTTFLNAAVLGGSQLLQVLITRHHNKPIIDEIIEDLQSISDGRGQKIYTELLQKTQDINAQYEGWTLLHYCTYTLSYMIQDGNSLINPFTPGSRLLILIEYLIEQGADIHRRDNYGRTPIYFSSSLCATHHKLENEFWECFPNSAELLNPKNADVQPLHVACSLVQKIVAELINKGAKTDALDKFGRMPLHCAAMNSRFEPEFLNVKALIYYEPKSLEHADNFGNYPLFYAALFGSEDLFQFVLAHSSVHVIAQVKEKWKSIEITEDKLREYEQQFKVYDPIYNVPPGLKIMFGGGKEKKEKQVKTQLQTAQNTKKTQYEKDDETYDTYHDGHGWKHVINEAAYKKNFPKQRDFIDSTKTTPAKFFPVFGKNYEILIKNCVETWVDKGADTKNLFVAFQENVGADNGNLTKTVEIYFSASGGAHIRPKYLS